MEDKHGHNHQPNNGFLMGAIVGAVATLLFTTKKGREIVREISDKGIEKLSEWENSIQVQDSLEESENDYIEPVEVEKLKLAGENIPEIEISKPEVKSAQPMKTVSKSRETKSEKSNSKSVSQSRGKAVARRFFKGPNKN
jgi:gas vesicle protein